MKTTWKEHRLVTCFTYLNVPLNILTVITQLLSSTYPHVRGAFKGLIQFDPEAGKRLDAEVKGDQSGLELAQMLGHMYVQKSVYVDI